MLPILTILVIACIGAFFGGLKGFLLWGFLGFIAVMLFGWIINIFNGGIIPRKVRDQVATDFIAAHPDLVAETSDYFSAYEMKEFVASVLEKMAEQAASNASILNLGSAGSAAVFLPSAFDVAEQQSPKIKQMIAHMLVNYSMEHPLLFGRR